MTQFLSGARQIWVEPKSSFSCCLGKEDVLLSCFFSSSVSTPQQTYNLSHLPTLQDRHFVGCILCMRNYFNFDDFNPDTPIGDQRGVETAERTLQGSAQVFRQAVVGDALAKIASETREETPVEDGWAGGEESRSTSVCCSTCSRL